jgi:hypothetical protein
MIEASFQKQETIWECFLVSLYQIFLDILSIDDF